MVIILKLGSYLETENETAVWFLFCYALIAIGSFIQILCIYILSAYVGRAYLEIKGRPSFVVMETIDKNNAHNC